MTDGRREKQRPAGVWAFAEAHPAMTVAVGIGIAILALVLNDRLSSPAAQQDESDVAAPARGTADAIAEVEGEHESTAFAALEPIGVDASEVDALVAALGRLPLHTPVWIAYPAMSPRAGAASIALGLAFERAGAVVRGTTALDYSVRPGVFVFAAEEAYPSYVDDVAHALGEAIPDVSVMSGYRAYGEAQRAENPSWQGLRMDQGETYVVVVGRVP